MVLKKSSPLDFLWTFQYFLLSNGMLTLYHRSSEDHPHIFLCKTNNRRLSGRMFRFEFASVKRSRQQTCSKLSRPHLNLQSATFSSILAFFFSETPCFFDLNSMSQPRAPGCRTCSQVQVLLGYGASWANYESPWQVYSIGLQGRLNSCQETRFPSSNVSLTIISIW
jgi:hypothetical protein